MQRMANKQKTGLLSFLHLGFFKKRSSGAEARNPLIIPAQNGPEAAAKRKSLYGKGRGLIEFKPGWDDPIEIK